MASRGTETDLAPGHRLDGYELLWPIGEGGMASVWVARLTRKHGFEKLVAIKTILPKFAEDESFQMFLDEARIASRIDHANVAHIHDLGEKDDVLYLVMEYVDGDALTRLRKVLSKRNIPFPVPIALRIMADVCAGLHAAHELKGPDGGPLGVVHRDVSPQNILITTDGISKLIDFGVAKAAGRLTEETHTGYVKGKVQYMAPEQALGRNVDRRADVWAVGAVIYHLIANRPPFEADNQLALLSLLQRGRPPAPLPPGVPPTVAELLKKALTHNAMQRFQSAAEMRTAIERTGLAATTEEVGAFVTAYLGETAARRRQSIASALQNADASAAPPPVAMSGMDASSTQKLSAAVLPKYLPPYPNAPPPSDSRIGPPTPQSFPSAPADSVKATTQMPGLASIPLPPLPPLGAPLSQSQSGMQTYNNVVPPGLTEPLPSPEAIEAALNENTLNESLNGGDTNGGSLGLASISASVNTRPQRGFPWALIGGVSVASIILAIAVGVGLTSRVGGAKKFDPQFSPLPQGSSAPVSPPPTHDELSPVPTPGISDPPAPTESITPVTPLASEPTTSTSPSTRPTTRAVSSGTFPYRPAPAGSAKKKPKIDDGF